MLGNLLGLAGLRARQRASDVQRDALGGRATSRAGSTTAIDALAVAAAAATPAGLQRIADVPIYFADPLVRRSPPLQKTRDARAADGAG